MSTEAPILSLPIVESADSSAHSRVVRTTAWVTMAIIAVKATATLKEFVVAGVYGRSDEMDAFLAAFLIPNLLVNLIAESTSQALLPALIRVRVRQGHRRAQELLSGTFTRLIFYLITAVLIIAVAAPFSFHWIAWDFPASKLALSLHLLYSLLPFVVLSGLSIVFSAVLNSAQCFLLPALASGLVPLCALAGTLWAGQRFGTAALAAATVIGASFQFLITATAMTRSGYTFRLQFSPTCEEECMANRQFGALFLSSIVASGGLVADQAFAATLPSGSIATLAFAGRFVGVITAILASSISSTLGPHFASLAAASDWNMCRATLRRWLYIMVVVSLPLTILLIASSPLLIRLTLQHGAFMHRDTIAVAGVLAVYAIQIPFFAISRIHYRFVLALGRGDLILICGTFNLGLNILLDLTFMRWMGVAGLALATSAWVIATCVFLWVCAGRLLRKAEQSSIPEGAV